MQTSLINPEASCKPVKAWLILAKRFREMAQDCSDSQLVNEVGDEQI